MIEHIDDAAEYLSNVFDDIIVKPAYAAEGAARPVDSPAFYVGAVSMEGGLLELFVCVDVPSSMGGQACQMLAESVCEALSDDGCPVSFSNVRYGSVEYRKQSMAFRVKVRADIDETYKRYSFTAFYFSSDRQLSISGTVKDYKLVRNFEQREIGQIFTEMPAGVTDDVDHYDITLIGVESDIVETISSNGVFALTVEGETFYYCYCVQSSENGQRRAEVKIRAYRGEYIGGADVPPPGHTF